MKKIALSLLLFLFIWTYSFASDLEVEVNDFQEEYSDKLVEVNTEIKNTISDLSELKETKEYLVLNAIWLIDFNELYDEYYEEYLAIRENLLNDTASINSKFIILQEKQELWIYSSQEYSTQVEKLSTEISWLKEKYNEQIDNLLSKYESELANLEDDLDSLKINELDKIQSIVDKETYIELILENYGTYEDNIWNVKKIFEIRYDDINDYITEVKSLTSEKFEAKLIKKMNTYLDKYKNLDYYKSDIEDYIDNMVDSYSTKFDVYFQNLIWDFYSKEDYEFIEKNYSKLMTEYLSDETVDYAALYEDDVEDLYEKLYSTIVDVNEHIEEKFATLWNATNLEELQLILQVEIQNYYDDLYVSKSAVLETFMNSKVELLNLKLISQLDSYNILWDKIEDFYSFNWTDAEKLITLNALQTNIKQFKTDLVDKDLRAKLESSYWELEAERIELIIDSESLRKYDSSYKNIDSRLDAILEALYEQAIDADKEDYYIEKLEQAIDKIDMFLNDSNIVQKSKYILLKIKKAIIKILYI